MIFDQITKEQYQALVVCSSKIDQDPSSYIRTYTASLKLPKFMMGMKTDKSRPSVSVGFNKDTTITSVLPRTITKNKNIFKL